MRSERRSGPVLEHVREVTGSLHDLLDADAEAQDILRGKISRQGYIRMLRAHQTLHRLVAACTEACTARTPDTPLLDWPHCNRLPALEADLARLDARSCASEWSALVPCDLDVAFACGLLYVVEGACHGTGQMLRALQKNARFVAWRADAFMHKSRASIRTRWPATVTLLERHGAAHMSSVAAGAVAGFECYASAHAKF